VADVTIAGLPIEDGLPDGDVPLAAVMVVRVLAADGTEAHCTRATEGLSTVEALGMAHLLVLKLGRALMDEDDGSE
jgi:hypothetical protein